MQPNFGGHEILCWSKWFTGPVDENLAGLKAKPKAEKENDWRATDGDNAALEEVQLGRHVGTLHEQSQILGFCSDWLMTHRWVLDRLPAPSPRDHDS